MARITIVSDRYVNEIRVALLKDGHTIASMPMSSSRASIEASNPELIIAPYTDNNTAGWAADDVLTELHDLGYPLILGFQRVTDALGMTVQVKYIISSAGKNFFAHTSDPMFDEVGIVADNTQYDIGGDRTCYDYNFGAVPYSLATAVAVQDYYGTILYADKGTVTSTGKTLEANVLFLGFIYGYDGTRASNTYAEGMLRASISKVLGGEFTVSGVTRDKFGELAGFDIRAYSTGNGNLLAISDSDVNTGVYSIDPKESGAMIMCVSDDPTVMTLVRDNADHTSPVDFDFSAGVGVPTDPTFTSIVTGNVTKYGLPASTEVVAVSIGEPRVVGVSVSDEVTGDYSIDVQPYTGEVAIYTLPEYGVVWSSELDVEENQVVHPTVPNGNVYVCESIGTLGTTEPVWSGDTVASGNVLLIRNTLTKPLINAFIKPVVTPL